MTTPEQAKSNLERRSREEKLAEGALFEQAASDARAIIKMIAERYRPRRIYQWGSLLAPGDFRDYSDIDIAVEGLDSAERFFALYRDAEALTRFPLDLVELEKIEPIHAETIRQKGKIVYER
jgi:predicted nucleotidyltransferase